MSLTYIDSHCHFDFAQFDEDRAALWLQCQAMGVAQLIVPGVSSQTFARAAQVCQDYKGLYFSAGIHPWWIAQLGRDPTTTLNEFAATITAKLRQLPGSEQFPCVAIGETGLDKRIESPMDLQLQLLHWHIELANSLQLPLIVHSVKAHAELLAAFKQNPPNVGGVIHGFSGSYEMAMQFIAQGFYLGVGATISYARAQKTRAAFKRVPLQWLLLETDAPDMPLSGRQGQRNSPGYIPEIAQCLAQLRAEPLELIAAQTTQNTRRLFKLPDSV